MDYPHHEFSQYIDNEFNDSNIEIIDNIDTMMLNKLKNISFNNDIMLEPRITEYINRKIYYKENNIKPGITPEQEYMITVKDLKLINKLLNGKKKIYDFNVNKDNSRPIIRQQYFPSTKFRKDNRVPKINNKLPENVNNMGMFGGEDFSYDYTLTDSNMILDGRDFRNKDINDIKYSPRMDVKMHPGELDFNPYKSQYKIKNPKGNFKTYSNGSKQLDTNQENLLKNDRSSNLLGRSLVPGMVDDLNNNVDRYGQFDEINLENYKSSNTNVNTNFESDLINGMPTRTAKSYGYRNPAEHYYDFIDPDFQNSSSNVTQFPQGGVPTRLQNKKLSNNCTREIL